MNHTDGTSRFGSHCEIKTNKVNCGSGCVLATTRVRIQLMTSLFMVLSSGGNKVYMQISRFGLKNRGIDVFSEKDGAPHSTSECLSLTN